MPPRKSTFSPHGASRAGDKYQDLWGIEVLLEWLAHPERYDWVRFECSEARALDKQLAEGEIVEAGFYTNHKPEPNLKSALVGLRIDLDRIGDAALRNKIEDPLGGAKKAQEFFARFDFHRAMGEPDGVDDRSHRHRSALTLSVM